MKTKFSVSAAYSLVTAAFTLGLLFFSLLIVDVVGGKGNFTSNQISFKVNTNQQQREVIALIEESRNKRIYDTLQTYIPKEQSTYFNQPEIVLPLRDFRKSHIVHYWWHQSKVIIVYLLWLFILYQLFLLLYDLKRGIFFLDSNTIRVRKIGFAFIIMAALYCVTTHYNMYQNTEGALVLIDGKSSTLFFGAFWEYLLMGSLVLALSIIFRHGSDLQKENNLTV